MKPLLILAAFIAAAFFFACGLFGIELGDVSRLYGGLFSLAIGFCIQAAP